MNLQNMTIIRPDWETQAFFQVVYEDHPVLYVEQNARIPQAQDA
jgi:hypothetical protein